MKVGDLVTVFNYVNEVEPTQYTILEIVDDEWLKVVHANVSGYFTIRVENVLEVISE